jgi:protein TonB
MPFDSESVSSSSPNLGLLESCLVEGDPEQRARERRVRRKALMISVSAQGAILAALVLIPLFAKPARIFGVVLPPAPYYSQGGLKRTPTQAPPRTPPVQNVCRFCPPLRIPHTTATSDAAPPTDGPIEGTVPGGEGQSFAGQIPLIGPPQTVRPPAAAPAQRSHVVRMTKIDPAMLIRRVEPVYPTLPKQLGRSGRVELHAIIATDGTIQSLQVVSGDPLFYRSALEAVRQWRYTPTVLNGEPVEIDTFITVIYHMDR